MQKSNRKEKYLWKNRMLQKLFSFCLSSHQLFALSAVGFLHQKGVRVLIKGAVALLSASRPVLAAACCLCWGLCSCSSTPLPLSPRAPGPGLMLLLAQLQPRSFFPLLQMDWLQPPLVLLPKWRLHSSSRLLTATYWIIVEYVYACICILAVKFWVPLQMQYIVTIKL